MEYISAKEAAAGWGITVRWVQQCCKNGLVPGAARIGKSWLIPKDASAPSGSRSQGTNQAAGAVEVPGVYRLEPFRIAMPLLNSAYPVGRCMDFIQTIADEDDRVIALCEYYYFSGRAEQAVEIAERYMGSDDPSLRYSASLIASFANLSRNQVRPARFAREQLKQQVLAGLHSNAPIQLHAMGAFTATAASVLLHMPGPRSLMLEEYVQYLPGGLKLYACYILAHKAYLEGNYERALTIADISLAVCPALFPVAAVYVNLIAAVALMSLKRPPEAKKRFQAAWELARPDDLLEPFGEHHGLLHGLIETELKAQYPAEYERIIAITYSFSAGWRRVHNPDTREEVADNLTTTLEISGGSVDGSIYVDTTPHPKGERGACTTTITGGKFSQKPESSFLGSGQTVVELNPAEGNLIYTVEKAEVDTPDDPEWKKELQKLNASKPVCTTDNGTHNATDGWTALTADTTTLASGGKFYVPEGGLTLTGRLTVSAGTVTLCLNGETLTTSSTANNRLITVSGGTLHICDCSAEQTGTLKGIGGSSTSDNNRQVLRISNAGTVVNLFGGTLTGGFGANSGGVDANTGTTFNMVGGTISGNNGYQAGGGVDVGATATMNMYGGTIKENHLLTVPGGTARGGGGVYVNSAASGAGVFNMYGGMICDNTSVEAGGGVYLYNSYAAQFNMYGGTITGNKATTAGGGVGTSRAGNIVNMYGGTISGNTATTQGGGVYNLGTFTMTGGTITANKATTNGSGVSNAGTFNLIGGSVDMNKSAGSLGTGVYTSSIFKMEGGTISGNEGSAKTGGGAVYLSSTGVFEMSGGEISGNTAGGNGYGAVYVNNQFTMSGGTISENDYVSGGVHVVGGKTFTMTDGCIGDKVYAGSDPSVITITGGKFGAKMTRDALAAFLPAESDTMTTVYSVMDYTDPAGKLVYQVGEGLYSEAEDKFMDFGSSLDLGVVLNAHRNFDAADFTSGYTVSAVSADTTYEAAFDTTTVPDSLILMAHGIAAKEMHDAITFTVKKGDVVWFEKTLSVFDVAKLWHGDGDTSDQTMLADMIAYGNAARKEFKYNYAEGDVLPVLDGASSAVAEEWTATKGVGVSNGQQNKAAVTLSLKDQIELNVYINDKAAKISNVKFDGADYAEANYKVDTTSGKYTRVSFFDIPVVDVKKAVEITVTMSDNTVFTVKYSIADYAVRAKNGDQGALIQELMEYVDSVSACLK